MLHRASAFLIALLFIGCAESTDSGESTSADTTTAQVPATDIYLAEITTEEGRLQIGPPRNITRRADYDNQPAFTPDRQALLYTSIRDDQADVYRYTWADSAHRQVTDTPTSEYSPTPRPGGGFTVVRVESDGTQRLWQFAMDGADLEVILPDVAPVGYHAWANQHQTALFVLGEPPTLQLADTRAASPDTLAQDIGRSLQTMPDRPAISFVQRTSDTTTAIHELDVNAHATRPLTETPHGGDDHAWTPDGTLLMARGSTLHQWTEAAGWQSVADLPLADITRLAVHPDGTHLALVAAE